MLHKYFTLIFIVCLLLGGCSQATPTANDHTPNSAAPETSAVAFASSGPESDNKTPDPQAKYVYLTFDDGPNSHYTDLVLDILKDYGVQASFAVIGSNVERNPIVLKRIVAEGHALINHTFSHDYNKIYAGPEAFLADIRQCEQAIAALTGKKSCVFRAPGGPSYLDEATRALLSENNYFSLGWNVTAADTDPNGATPEQIYGNVAHGVLRAEEMQLAPIILMHDGTEIDFSDISRTTQVYIKNRESDLAALPRIIEFLLERGYSFAVVDETTPGAW